MTILQIGVAPPPQALEHCGYTQKVAENGLQVQTFNADLGYFNNLEGDRNELTRAFLKDLHLAQVVSAIGVCVGCGVPTAPNDITSDTRVVADRLRESAAAAADKYLILIVEAPYHFRLFNTMPLALELIERIDHPNATLASDASHVWASGADIAEAAQLFGDRIRAYAHHP